ncbi:MAG: hypothetical protein AAGI23_09270 [Bacteroidota bacterium]
MLENWLKGVPFKNEDFKSHQLGHSIRFHNERLPDLQRVKVVLIGTDDMEANAARQALYQLADHFPRTTIADLGNIRKKEVSFLIPVLKELITKKRSIILLGKSLDWRKAQQQAHRQLFGREQHWLSIDDRVRTDTSDRFGQRIIVGGQRHLTKRSDLQKMERKKWWYHSLGSCRSELKAVEPSIRDAHFGSVHLAALKDLEVPGQLNASPSGFFLEEACQLMYYAGMNEQLLSMGLYGWQAKKKDTRSPQALAQLIWYFMEGVAQRKGDYPLSKASLGEYIVHLKDQDIQVTFWKSYKSGRWWLQLPTATERNHLIPCSYEDYQLAGRGEVSDRVMQILARY